MKPTELPELRRQVVNWLGTPHAKTIWDSAAHEGRLFGEKGINFSAKNPAAVGDGFRGLELTHWRMAELFHVSEAMTRLSVSAAETLPEFQVEPVDLPSTFGVMYFELPIDGSVVACAWGVVPQKAVDLFPILGCNHGGVWLSFWCNGTPEFKLPLGYLAEFLIGFGSVPQKDLQFESLGRLTRIVRTAWLLMQQEVAAVSRCEPTRKDLKRLQRKKLSPTAVRVVSLRRPHSQSSADEESSRNYSHRWIVRGHWRKQWYPSQNRHIPIFIQAHVKGPENAPFLTGELVNAWRR